MPSELWSDKIVLDAELLEKYLHLRICTLPYTIYTMHTINCTVYIVANVQFTLYTIYCILDLYIFVAVTISNIQRTLIIVHCIYTSTYMEYTVYNQHPLYTVVQCTLYYVHIIYIVYDIHFILWFNVHCTMYTLYT